MSEQTQNIVKINPFIKNNEMENIHISMPSISTLNQSKASIPTAIIYCEANFGKIDGKTANGLVRHSQNYRVLSVIDSQQAGLDSGVVLGDEANEIPIVSNLGEAVAIADETPDYFIFGLAPSSGMLSESERSLILEAMALKMNIVNGLHEFLNDDPQLVEASKANNVEILDIRRPKNKKDLQAFSGKIHDTKCPRIAIMGTDCAIGKRTTATMLTKTLQEHGLNVVMIATGQTGIIQGAPYGVALDAVPSQFCAGELEAIIVKAYELEEPDLIIIEGQGALSHPAFSTSAFILRGSCPTGVILQHAPNRLSRSDFPKMPMPSIASEIELIEMFADTPVIGLTLNHENMSSDEILFKIQEYSAEFSIPVTDALSQPKEHLLHMVLSAFPHLNEKLMINKS
ncbi:DUF1611 domain-containing protein [Photobacterium sp.]|uniref:DUF1611 domain-containing protein n=1 Tax=Photobacterium sp. TaxID=660 RepID=UPI0039AF5EDD